MNDAAATAPEMSRPVALDRIGSEGTEMAIEASETERAALADRFGLVRIDDLRADVALSWLEGRKRLRLAARIRGSVVQTCVVSLEPVDNEVDDTVEILFEPAADAEDAAEVVLAGSDDAEPIPGDPMDVGEIIAEEFALALDPYPRRDDAGEIGESAQEGAESAPRGPFQNLARLKRDL